MTPWCPANKLEWYKVIILSVHVSGTARTAVSFLGLILNKSESEAKSEEIGETLIENMITKYCIPEYLIMDQDSAFMSSLMTSLLNKFNIKIRTVAS